MGKLPKQPPSAMKQLGGWAKSRWRSIASVVGGLILLLTLIKSVNDNSETIEAHFIPASHSFVRSEIHLAGDGTTKILRDLQTETAEGKRDAAKEAKSKWSLELEKATDPTTKDLIRGHMNDLDATIDRLNAQIRTLNRLQQ